MKEMESAKVDTLESLGKLSPARRALLAQRLKEKKAVAASNSPKPQPGAVGAQESAEQATGRERYLYSAPPVMRATRDEEIPLSFAQQRLWFIDQLEPGQATYNVVAAVRLIGPLDVAALEESFNEIERRHETLRTKFTSVSGRPVQTILPPLGTVLRTISLDELDEQARQEEGMRLAAEEAQLPFDLAQGRLFRARLIRLGEPDDHALLLTMHHIVSDGWSMGVLVGEMGALYGAFSNGSPSPLAELPVQYADYAYWQREWLQGEVLESQFGYWKQQLAGAPPVLDLPTDRPRPPVPTFHGARRSLVLPESLTESLKAIARSEGASLFMVLLAAFKILLYRYSGQADIVVGTPIANRGRSELEGLIGFFANTLALRTDLSNNPSFKELLSRVRDAALGAYAHQDIPFERLVEKLNPERQMSRQPLFQVMFAFQNAPATALETPSLRLQPFATEFPVSKFDLTLTMAESGRVISGSLEYSTALFDSGTVAGMLKHLEILLTGAAENPDRRILDLPLISEDERQQLVFDWNRTGRDYAPTCSVSQFFEAQVEATPDAPAVCYEAERVSYRELNSRANQLARYLQKQGVGPETRVGICVERSMEMLVAVLGVLKAGGAYVPLDPAYPRERLAFMLEDSQALLLLTQERLVTGLPRYAGQVLCLDSEWDAIAIEATEKTENRTQPDNLCYVIYTSGSTGQPKGVAMTHRALANLIEWQHNELRLEPGVKTLQLSSLSFDASFNEMFSTWVSGGTLILMSEEARRDPVALWALLARQGVERLLPPYASLQQLADIGVGEEQAPLGLREILSTAAQLRVSSSIVKMMSGMKGCVLHNEYGPSETHVVTAFKLSDAPDKWPALPPIGRPIANTQIYLLDAQMQNVPVGVFGELYAGGASLARGYLNKPEMTAERFVPDPCGQEPGARLYRTGDLARYLPDGNIEYVGRIDHQVKIRGYRIEPGEIETVLARHPAVSDVAVVVREDEPGEKRLVAYWVTGQNPAPKVSELFGFLRERLPEYMVPSAYLELEALPLSPNGKVDRRALPAPDQSRPELAVGFLAPTTVEEEIVAGIWTRVLKLERVGVRDNFFELGGHSLLATQVISRIRDAFQVEVPLRRLFETPTVAGLAAYIEEALREGARIEPVPPIVRRVVSSAAPPLASFAQERLWFTDQLEPGRSTYNIPAAVPLDGQLNVVALKRSLSEVVRRHDVLRTNLSSDDGKLLQLIHPAEPFPLPVIDLSALCSGDEEGSGRAAAEARRLAQMEARRGFDLEHDSLLRVNLLRVSDDLYVLLLTMHHVISDAWSMNVLVREVTALYEAYRAGRESPLRELQFQYADYALWQRELLTGKVLERELGYWKKQLAGAPEVLALPWDRPRRSGQARRAGVVGIELSRELSDGLRALSRHEGATLFMVLLAGFNVLLSRHSGQRDIVIGTSVAGRNRGELEDLIGFFVNMLAIRTEVSGEMSFRELIRRVREVVIDGQTHQGLPFERLVEELSSARSFEHSPIFQVLFTLNNTEAASGAVPVEFTAEQVERDTLREEKAPLGEVAAASAPGAKYDLNLVWVEAGNRISGALEYDRDLFDEATIERLAAHYLNVLQAVVTDADARIAELPLMGETERQQILNEWNDTQRPYPRQLCMHQLFEEQAARTPEALALVHDAEQISYKELNERANKVAHTLRRLGVGPETPVALYMERSLEMVVGLLGILKAGAAYVPLDPLYPQERLRYMLEDSGATFVLTQQSLLSQLGISGERAICLDTGWEMIAREESKNPFNQVTPENLAYVIYTSGSTGQPKGVAIEHHSASAFIHWSHSIFSDLDLKVTLASTSICFDLSVFELFVPLARGGMLLLADNALQLPELAMAPQVTLINTVPSAMAELVRTRSLPQSLRVVNLAGEPLKNELVQAVYGQVPEAVVWNLYGPSESTTYSTAGVAVRGGQRQPSIGRPIANTQVYVLDEDLQAVPVGVTGQLHIGGAGLARGYLERPELTAEKFIPNPYEVEGGGRLYRTGDLARYERDGELEYVGRKDTQVKVRGYRIELGEVEVALVGHGGVREAVVVVREETGGEKRLVAYVVGAGEDVPSGAELQRYLKGKLPGFMVPSVFVRMEQMPLTTNGKVDRRALLAVNDAQLALETKFVAPRTLVEQELAEMWSELLGVERVGVLDNFFELGGHSILLTQLRSRIAKSYDVNISLRTMFDVPTIADLTVLIAQGQIEQQDSSEMRQMLDELKHLSPEEVKALLEAEEEPGFHADA